MTKTDDGPKASSDDTAKTSIGSAKSTHNKKEYRPSTMKKKETAEDLRDKMINTCHSENEKKRADRKKAHLDGRRQIQNVILVEPLPIKHISNHNHDSNYNRDALADGLNDKPAAWETHSSDDESSIDFGSSMMAEEDFDNESVHLDNLI